MEDGVMFDIKNYVDRWLGRSPELFVKIQHDLAEKTFIPGQGWVGDQIVLGFL